MKYNLIFPKNDNLEKKKTTGKRLKETTRQFAKATTIHGCSYIFHERNCAVERLFWMVVVALALTLTTYQVVTLYDEWQDEPVITVLETVAEPIDNIKFPAVTICPQGSRQEIVDAVLFRQLKTYINSAKEGSETLTADSMMQYVDQFLRDVYPGANGKPTQLVKLLSSDNPRLSIQNDAILDLEEDCDPSENIDIFENMNKALMNDTCPEGFNLMDNIYCIHVGDKPMSYSEAVQYCDQSGGTEVLYIESEHELNALYKSNKFGNFLA